MRRINLVLVTSLFASLATPPAMAETVTLRSENGGVSVTGDLLEFDGETYLVRTNIGDLRLAANAVICEGADCPVIEQALEFVVSGTAELADSVFPELLKSFAAQADVNLSEANDGPGLGFTATLPDAETDATINVRGETSTLALQNLMVGSSSIALTSRSPNRTETAALQAAGIDEIQETILGVGGLVIVTPTENPLPSISIRDAARVFSGEVSNWSEVGGPDAAINLYIRTNGSIVGEVFNDLILAPSGLNLDTNATVVETDSELDELVAGDPFAIGFKQFSATGAARQMPVIGECGLVVSPTEFNIKAEEYPLSYRLMALANGAQNNELMTPLMTFMRGEAAQALVSGKSAISQQLARSAVDQQGMRFASALSSSKVIDAIPRLQKMASEMVVSERLSATFRFEAGSRELDERGRRDIERVVALLNAETANGAKKIVRIIGFTDSLGAPELNQELSERRARQVHDTLIGLDPELESKVEFRPMGFGDVSPIGCDQSARGRWVNRRVEIWVSGATQ